MAMKLEKKNRIISIFSIVITIVCLAIIALLLINYLKVRAENEELKSQLEESTQTRLVQPESAEELSIIL